MTPFEKAVLDEVDRIPAGSVSTYSDVAARAGKPRAPRSVGGTLSRYGDEVPWHRVLRADGSIPDHTLAEATARLLAEGVLVRDGRVDLAAFLWDGPVLGPA